MAHKQCAAKAIKCLRRPNYVFTIYTAVHTLWFKSPDTADCIFKLVFFSQLYW